MKKIVIITGLAVAAALLPAGIGLAANPSLSARVPVAPAQVRLASGVTTPAPSRTQVPIDDKGGNRPAGVSDDGPTHDAGDDRARHHRAATPAGTATVDDHGGDRPAGVSDDGPTHDAGDDKGGSGKSDSSGSGSSGSGSSGSGSSGRSGGSDDGSGHDKGDDKGGDN